MVCLVQNLRRVVNVVCLVQNLGEWMDGRREGRKDGWKDGRESGVKDCLQQSKTWLLNGWVDEWMGVIKLNYNGSPFSKMVRFL